MTNTRITDPEILENRYPLRLQKFAIRRKSGGKGAFTGGNGVVRIIEFTADAAVSVLSQHREIRPYGMSGGKPGKRGRQWLIRPDGSRTRLKAADSIEAAAGDRLKILTPGGGGWGEPEKS